MRSAKMCPILSIGQPEPINCKMTDCEWFRGSGSPNDPGLCAITDVAGWLSALSNLAGDKPSETSPSVSPVQIINPEQTEKTEKTDE